MAGWGSVLSGWWRILTPANAMPSTSAGYGSTTWGRLIMSTRGCSHLATSLAQVIDRFRSEYQMSYAEVVGVLEILKAQMIKEAFDETGDSGEAAPDG
jgi:hypothetical protein